MRAWVRAASCTASVLQPPLSLSRLAVLDVPCTIYVHDRQARAWMDEMDGWLLLSLSVCQLLACLRANQIN